MAILILILLEFLFVASNGKPVLNDQAESLTDLTSDQTQTGNHPQEKVNLADISKSLKTKMDFLAQILNLVEAHQSLQSTEIATYGETNPTTVHPNKRKKRHANDDDDDDYSDYYEDDDEEYDEDDEDDEEDEENREMRHVSFQSENTEAVQEMYNKLVSDAGDGDNYNDDYQANDDADDRDAREAAPSHYFERKSHEKDDDDGKSDYDNGRDDRNYDKSESRSFKRTKSEDYLKQKGETTIKEDPGKLAKQASAHQFNAMTIYGGGPMPLVESVKPLYNWEDVAPNKMQYMANMQYSPTMGNGNNFPQYPKYYPSVPYYGPMNYPMYQYPSYDYRYQRPTPYRTQAETNQINSEKNTLRDIIQAAIAGVMTKPADEDKPKSKKVTHRTHAKGKG